MQENITIDFYNKESAQYSQKRYQGPTRSYFQFLFKRRRQLFIDFISIIGNTFINATALEIGCADGVIVKKLLQKFPKGFSQVVGVDISPKMIEEARQSTTDSRAVYFLRGEENPTNTYNLVTELGVHANNFEEEMKFVYGKLNFSGYFVYSASGINSLHAKIKLGTVEYRNDYLTYGGYETIIQKYFTIINSEVYGLFIPKLWAFPSVARVLQPVLESIFKYLTPGLFHEKIYLLQKKP